jgi:hypothetical protein
MLRKLGILLLVVVMVFSSSGCGGGGTVTTTDSGDNDGTDGDTGDYVGGPYGGLVEEHANLTWDGSPGQCLQCHESEAREMHASVHYQWKGAAIMMTSGPQIQGKIAGAVNSYCINIEGNWEGCGKCHAGQGDKPTETADGNQLANIDCLMCHQKDYKRKLVNGKWVPDTAAMSITLDEAVITAQLPTREDCLRCHAYAGGADAVKRGDITQAHSNTSDSNFDVHMSAGGENMNCTSCHTTNHHQIAGKGSDLRPSESLTQMSCADCHSDKASGSGHGDPDIDKHVARVACQTCHIPVYARNASDTAATEATETHRTWRSTHSTSAPFHPAATLANNLQPEYLFYDGTSSCANLGEVANVDQSTGNYPTSRPNGSVSTINSKLHAFKYKTAEQPRVNRTGEFLALDTSMYFATGDGDASARQGLVNMGLSSNEPYSWIITETYQMLNHEVSPHSQALDCSACHGTTTRMDLKGKLGYELKKVQSDLCNDCHSSKTASFTRVHDKHVDDERIDCSRCHNFSRL